MAQAEVVGSWDAGHLCKSKISSWQGQPSYPGREVGGFACHLSREPERDQEGRIDRMGNCTQYRRKQRIPCIRVKRCAISASTWQSSRMVSIRSIRARSRCDPSHLGCSPGGWGFSARGGWLLPITNVGNFQAPPCSRTTSRACEDARRQIEASWETRSAPPAIAATMKTCCAPSALPPSPLCFPILSKSTPDGVLS